MTQSGGDDGPSDEGDEEASPSEQASSDPVSNLDADDEDAFDAAQFFHANLPTINQMDAEIVYWGFPLEPRFNTILMVRFYWKACRIYQYSPGPATTGGSENGGDDQAGGEEDEEH